MLNRLGLAAVVLFSITIGGPKIAAQQGGSVSLEDQLRAQYKVAKVGTDANGLAITDPGTVLTVQKGGLLGVAPTNPAMCASKFQDGDLKAPNGFCVAMVKQNSRLLQVGEKVYPIKIDVNVDKDKISFKIVECDSCNGTQEPSMYKAQVDFQFAKGSLRNTPATQIEDTIGQVLALDSGGDVQGGENAQSSQNHGSQNQGAPNQGAQVQGAEQAPPKTIELGQTRDQVVEALGQPEKIVNLGSKQIYVYKDMKVTFLNGKVSDVQ